MSSPSAPVAGTATTRAYEFAKWAILSSVYPAGAVITESGLAHEVGLSRTPVRHALLRLEVEGLVTLHARRGAVVNSFSMRDVENILEVRVLVENHTAGRSFDRRKDPGGGGPPPKPTPGKILGPPQRPAAASRGGARVDEA